jgi:hypothetical protein
MPLFRTLRVLFVLGASLIAAGCQQEPGRVYKASANVIHGMLKEADLPPFVFGTNTPEWEVDSRDKSKVAWVVKKRGKEMVRLVANLTPVNDTNTRVSVEVIGATDGAAGSVAEKLAQNPKIADMYIAALEERVSSTLEGRQFELSRIRMAMAAAAMTQASNVHQSVMKHIAADHKRRSDNVAKAYANE